MKSTVNGIRKAPLLHPELSAGVHELRGALTDLLGDVGADIRRPQELAKKLSLDRSLAWRLSRTVGAGDLQNALQYMPGDAALNIVLKAVKGAGGGMAPRQRAEGAIKNFQTAVQRHLGDRPTLDLVIDGLPSDNGEQLSVSRKLAFRGNSGILGVQAKARFHTVLLAPNRDRPGMIDCGLIGGWIDFRRIRGDARWILFRRAAVGDVRRTPNQDEPMDPHVDPTGPALIMRDFCSPVIPEIQTLTEDGVLLDEIGPSTIGNSGAFTCVFGSITRAIGPRKADGPEDKGRFRVSLSAPVETLQFDMLIHRDCEFALEQTIKTYCGFAVGNGEMPERDLLPIHASRSDLGSEPPVVQSALFPRYTELTEQAFARIGCSRDQFIGIRYEIAYPPFPSTVSVSFPLESSA